MGRANLIAELLKGKPVKKFVVVGEGQRKGQVGESFHDLYNGKSVDLRFSDGRVMCCLLSDLRELDDSPIAAGDEVVCVDAKIRSGATGEHSGIKLGASYFPDFVSETGIYFGTSGWDKDRFVKVKPIAPEVKQEAVEPKPRIKYPMSTTTIGREFWMVKGFGPASHEHADYESALKEAERLAREHEGVPFTVMQSREVFCSGVVKFDPDFNRYTDTPF